MPGLASLERTREVTDEHRRQRKAIQRAQTQVWLYRNLPGQIGLNMRGRINILDAAKHKFQSRDNISSPGYITLPARHYLAKWIVSIPNDPESCKQVIIRVDRYGGAWRWSGMMHHWTAETIDGVDWVTAHFNDDLAFLQHILVPPNPALPLPVFQFPRDFFLVCPTAFGAAAVGQMQFVRQFANIWTMSDDPFDLSSYPEGWDTRTWQAHMKGPQFMDDPTLWGIFAARMNSYDTVIADPMDDAQVSMTYRRIFTDEGETVDGLFQNDIANGAIVFEPVDRSGFSREHGTYLSGNAAQGFLRTGIVWTSDLLEGINEFMVDDQSFTPDEYHQAGWIGTKAVKPAHSIRDSYVNDLQAKVSYSPAGPTQIVIGGDNPTADALAQVLIASVGNLLGYFLLLGFDSAGDIAADIIMPFLVGTIAAWAQFELPARATNLGWAHLLEVYVSGAEQNVWSLSALATARGGVNATDDETGHTMVIDESTWFIPGLHGDIGDRVGSTAGVLERMGIDLMFTNQIKEMTLEGDETGKSQFLVKVGENKAAMSRGERNARMLKTALDRISDIGVHLVQ